jgi:hypothetical protein
VWQIMRDHPEFDGKQIHKYLIDNTILGVSHRTVCRYMKEIDPKASREWTPWSLGKNKEC